MKQPVAPSPADEGRAAALVRVWDPAAPEIALTIDGRAVTARAGDTLLTAILTVRPDLGTLPPATRTRAGFCLMGACQDCWVRVAGVGRVRACTTEASAGMEVVIEPTEPDW